MFLAMPWPMRPKPMKPTRSFSAASPPLPAAGAFAASAMKITPYCRCNGTNVVKKGTARLLAIGEGRSCPSTASMGKGKESRGRAYRLQGGVGGEGAQNLQEDRLLLQFRQGLGHRRIRHGSGDVGDEHVVPRLVGVGAGGELGHVDVVGGEDAQAPVEGAGPVLDREEEARLALVPSFLIGPGAGRRRPRHRLHVGGGEDVE